jgi:hypothetical protein
MNAYEQARKFIGMELKESYFKQAVANLHAARCQMDELFASAEDLRVSSHATKGDYE